MKTRLEKSGLDLEISWVNGKPVPKVTDPETGEPYTLYLDPHAKGEFVGTVRQEVEEILNGLPTQKKELLRWIHENWNETEEFLWEKFPEDSIIRRADNRKWYASS